MANSNKTKAEILQELESIKGLLLEEDDIPILQAIDQSVRDESPAPESIQVNNPSVLPGQTSLFGDDPAQERQQPFMQANPLQTPQNTTRPLAKASGENPFLPQHIRERLHGNNPPPLFEYETAKKILNSTKHIAHKINKPRQALVDEVLGSLMPLIERELRHRLFAMSVEDLEKLLNEDED